VKGTKLKEKKEKNISLHHTTAENSTHILPGRSPKSWVWKPLHFITRGHNDNCGGSTPWPQRIQTSAVMEQCPTSLGNLLSIDCTHLCLQTFLCCHLHFSTFIWIKFSTL